MPGKGSGDDVRCGVTASGLAGVSGGRRRGWGDIHRRGRGRRWRPPRAGGGRERGLETQTTAVECTGCKRGAGGATGTAPSFVSCGGRTRGACGGRAARDGAKAGRGPTTRRSWRVMGRCGRGLEPAYVRTGELALHRCKRKAGGRVQAPYRSRGSPPKGNGQDRTCHACGNDEASGHTKREIRKRRTKKTSQGTATDRRRRRSHYL